jgi:putative NADH-flavin reductase
MKVLFIGGTGIISTGVTQLAVERGIDLSLLNRGQSRKMIPSDVKVIKGDIRDRKSASKLLKMHDFDVVVNVCADARRGRH